MSKIVQLYYDNKNTIKAYPRTTTSCVFDESGKSVKEQLDNIEKHVDKSTYNVKDYGAIGNGIDDDYEAINRVINIVKTTGGTIFFPTGVYAISKPLEVKTDDGVMLHNIVFKGVPSNIPYIHSYGENPKKLAMNSNIIPTNDFEGEALIIFNRVANTLVTDLALIGAETNQHTQKIKGILYNYKNLVSNNAVRNCAIYRFTTGIDGYYAPILKVEFTNVQYCSNEGIVVRGDSRIVECEVSLCGVKYKGTPGEMSTKEIFQPNGYYGGTGIKVIDGAGNTNIIGGLIDWNCKGIVADGASGLIVNGVRFHHNAEQHIWIRSKQNSLGSCGFNITGCRFLGGGFLTGTLDGKCAINIVNESSFKNPIYGNISGNVFRYGDWDATENSDGKLSTPTATSGPLNASIMFKVDCKTDLNISGNDMINCSSNGMFGATQLSSSEILKIKEEGNNYSKLGWTSGNVRIYSNGLARANGKPTWVGVNGEQTINTNPSPYAWDGYIYYANENTWKGINQRNIEYVASPSNKDGYVDRGYMVWNTTDNKLKVWSGATYF